jgi:hypothetical protein
MASTKFVTKLSNDDVQRLWRDRICKRAKKIDPNDEQDWYSMWIGFVVALGREDLMRHTKYMDIGFPVECEGNSSNIGILFVIPDEEKR